MPTLTLQISPEQSPARLASLASALTRITAEVLNKRAEVTAVAIVSSPTGHWFVGGKIPQLPTAMLQISITAGTNTPEQKANFIAAAFAELERQLGQGKGLEIASYVAVHELPADNWGYGGRTQLSRRMHS
jgi:4-oxalocrotonate tautomerase